MRERISKLEDQYKSYKPKYKEKELETEKETDHLNVVRYQKV